MGYRIGYEWNILLKFNGSLDVQIIFNRECSEFFQHGLIRGHIVLDNNPGPSDWGEKNP